MRSNLRDLLLMTVEKGASDLHIIAGEVPSMRIQGEIKRLNMDSLSNFEVRQLANQLMTDQQRGSLNDHLSVDFSFALQGRARFRANIYMQDCIKVVLQRLKSFCY